MKAAITIICFALLSNGCVPMMAGAITHNALERNADRKEWVEKHRHQERMRELDLQEKVINRQYPQSPQGEVDGGIVRESPF